LKGLFDLKSTYLDRKKFIKQKKYVFDSSLLVLVREISPRLRFAVEDG